MKILHITPSTNGYEEVELISNEIDIHNHLSLVAKNGVKFYTGGFLLYDTPEIRTILNKIPLNEVYNFVKMLRDVPFVKQYASEEDLS